eukprot:CAMPEP_0180512126 /NCGR_PEP_ID=MMETSP1036_2-20121128/51413_1 /TAXON_ID=632150 /ORGANISM="Azadinium spinosum, Strain 3D9" /LENGTH=59 /DNA_ID=CAMNT_0022523227 /DNA_START=358 /DNA_END=534 /DNA_ORIENTATION=-
MANGHTRLSTGPAFCRVRATTKPSAQDCFMTWSHKPARPSKPLTLKCGTPYWITAQATA